MLTGLNLETMQGIFKQLAYASEDGTASQLYTFTLATTSTSFMPKTCSSKLTFRTSYAGISLGNLTGGRFLWSSTKSNSAFQNAQFFAKRTREVPSVGRVTVLI